MKNTLLLLLTIILFIQCQTESDIPDIAQFSTIAQTIIQPNKGVLRGIDFGMDKTAIKNTEKANLDREWPNIIRYDIDIDIQKQKFVDITYKFNNQEQLTVIQVDSYVENIAEAKELYQELKTYFCKRYGHHESFWEIKDKHHKVDISLTLYDDTEDPGVLIVWERD